MLFELRFSHVSLETENNVVHVINYTIVIG